MRYFSGLRKLALLTISVSLVLSVFTPLLTSPAFAKTAPPESKSCKSGGTLEGDDSSGYRCKYTKTERSLGSTGGYVQSTKTEYYEPAQITCTQNYDKKNSGDRAYCELTPDGACVEQHGLGYTNQNGECINKVEQRSAIETTIVPALDSPSLKEAAFNSKEWGGGRGCINRGLRVTADQCRESTEFKNWYKQNVLYECSRQASSSTEAEIQAGTGGKNKFYSCLSRKGINFSGLSTDEKGKIDNADFASLTKSVDNSSKKNLENTEEDGENKETPTCESHIGALGWLICGVINTVSNVADGLWQLFEAMLVVTPLNIDTSSSNYIYKTWETMRDFANALIVIVIIAVIFSQISNIGISNYGVKKILPRVIIIAIAINISFYLMAVVVDITNILGKGVYSILTNNLPTDINVSWSDLLQNIIAVGVIGNATLIAGTIAWAAVGPAALLIFLLTTIIPAVISVIAGVVALLFRSAIMQMFAALSPIALVAWILPNTQWVFNKWKSVFFGLAFVYPLASLYYAGLKIFCIPILLAPDQNVIMRLMALALLFIGSVVVPAMVIKSNSVLSKISGTVGGALGKVANPATSALAGAAGGLAATKRRNLKARLQSGLHSKDFDGHISSGSRFRRIIGRGGKFLQGLDDQKQRREIDTALWERQRDRKFKERLAAQDPENSSLSSVRAGVPGAVNYISELAHSVKAEDIKNAELSIGKQSLDQLAETMKKALEGGDTIMAQAAQNRLLTSGASGVEKFASTIKDIESKGGTVSNELRGNLLQNHGSTIANDPALGKWTAADKDGNFMNMADSQASAYATPVSLSKFAGMTKEAQTGMIDNGGVNVRDAVAILSDKSSTTYASLDPTVISKLEQLASPSTGTNQPQQQQSGGQQAAAQSNSGSAQAASKPLPANGQTAIENSLGDPNKKP